MENAADALKIAFGLIVFTIAITLLFIMTSNTRSTADVVLAYADDTNYYDHLNAREKNRIVKVSDVITTLYRYNNESIGVRVVFKPNPSDPSMPTVFTFDIGNETDEDGKKVYLKSPEEQEKNLGKFIEKRLLTHPDMEFNESFVEIPEKGGIYLVDEKAGTEITLTAGSKKIFITYEEYVETDEEI